VRPPVEVESREIVQREYEPPDKVLSVAKRWVDSERAETSDVLIKVIESVVIIGLRAELPLGWKSWRSEL
jgi:hypothetical protein